MSSKSNNIGLFSRIHFPQANWIVILGYFTGVILLITALLNIHGLLYPGKERLTKFQNAVLEDPFSPESHKNLGNYYAGLGNIKEATREYELAYSLGSTDVLGAYKEIANRKKDLESELRYWEKQLKEKPGYRDAMLRSASLHYQLNNIQKVRHYLNLASQIDPNYPPLLKLQEQIK